MIPRKNGQMDRPHTIQCPIVCIVNCIKSNAREIQVAQVIIIIVLIDISRIEFSNNECIWYWQAVIFLMVVSNCSLPPPCLCIYACGSATVLLSALWSLPPCILPFEEFTRCKDGPKKSSASLLMAPTEACLAEKGDVSVKKRTP
jgi:hypothetical protein